MNVFSLHLVFRGYLVAPNDQFYMLTRLQWCSHYNGCCFCEPSSKKSQSVEWASMRWLIPFFFAACDVSRLLGNLSNGACSHIFFSRLHLRVVIICSLPSFAILSHSFAWFTIYLLCYWVFLVLHLFSMRFLLYVWRSQFHSNLTQSLVCGVRHSFFCAHNYHTRLFCHTNKIAMKILFFFSSFSTTMLWKIYVISLLLGTCSMFPESEIVETLCKWHLSLYLCFECELFISYLILYRNHEVSK